MPLPKMVRPLSWPALFVLAGCLYPPQVVSVSTESGFQSAACYGAEVGFAVVDSAARVVREGALSNATWHAQLFISLHGDSADAVPLDWKWVGGDSVVANYEIGGRSITWNLHREGRLLLGTASVAANSGGYCDNPDGKCSPPAFYFTTQVRVTSSPIELSSIPCSFLAPVSGHVRLEGSESHS